MTKVGIELDVEAGGFVSGMASAERAVDSLSEAMKQAKAKGTAEGDEEFVRLQIQRDTLKASTYGFSKDTQKLFNTPHIQTTTANGLAAVKLDSESSLIFKDLTKNIKNLSGVMIEQINSGDFEGARQTASQIQQEQGKYKKAVDEVAAPEGMQSKALKNSMAYLVFSQIANGINEGLSKWVGSLDRSGIVNAYGSGDIMGGRIAEERRQANLAGGIAETATSTLGGALMLSGNPYAMAGGALLSLGGKAFSTLLQKEPIEEANEAAYAGLWQQRSADAMNLAALMGDPKQVRDAFKIAADAAAAFGFSAEEGMDAIKQATQQGLTGKEAVAAAKQVYQYERSTGADRGTLSSLVNMSTRFNAGDALRAGWAGLQASGMTPGQYNEFLRGIYRVMEEGISKGFVKSADQVATSFTMLSQMSGNDPLWQGEHGARRLSDINAGLESATGLNSSSDIHVYRAARKIAEDEGLGDSYWEAMKIMEAGLGGEHGLRLLHETMKLNMAAEGGGMEGVGERVRQQFGFNYTLTDKFLKDWLPYKDKDSKDFASFWESQKAKYDNAPLPDARSPELEWAQLTAQTANITVQTGQIKFDEAIPKLREERKKAEDTLNDIRSGKGPADISTLTPAEGVEVRKHEFQEAVEKTGTGSGMMGGGFGQLTRAYKNLQDAEKTAAQTTFGTGDVDRLRTRSASTINGLFDTGLLLPKDRREENKQQQNKMLGTFGKALESNDEAQIQAVADALKIFESASKETREKWSADGTSNSWANSTDVLELLRQLHSDLLELNYATKENGKVHVEIVN